jgi:hypothetical protein
MTIRGGSSAHRSPRLDEGGPRDGPCGRGVTTLPITGSVVTWPGGHRVIEPLKRSRGDHRVAVDDPLRAIFVVTGTDGRESRHRRASRWRMVVV